MNTGKLSPEQEIIRLKCFHPTGKFLEFTTEEAERSVPERFEKIVRLHPQRLAVKEGNRSLTYDELNQTANRIARAILARCGDDNECVALLFEQGVEAIHGKFVLHNCFQVEGATQELVVMRR